MPKEIKSDCGSGKEEEKESTLDCWHKNRENCEKSDEDYWEEMLFISRGPSGWNIGCGCG